MASLLGASLTGCANDVAGGGGQPGRDPETTTTSTSTTAATAAGTTPTSAASRTVPPADPAAVEIGPEGDLYADPPALSDEPPGRLLRYQRVGSPTRFDGTRTPGDLWRIMYTSTNDLGGPIPVTGTVRVPTDRALPSGGWPAITWAHGTSGAADRCAPSKQLDFPPVPDPLVSDGFLIVATDYAGLGTPGLHPYFDGGSEGRAVLDIIGAADGLPGVDVADRFAIWGHSQGGHAALFARQLAADRLPDAELVGTVAFAPPSLVKDAMSAILVALQPKGFAAMTVAGIAATHPDAELADILTPDAVAMIEGVVDTGCAADVDRALRLFGTRDIVRVEPSRTQPWARYLDAAEPAMSAGSGPLLIVHSSDDTTVPALMSATVKDRTCARGEPTLRWLTGHGGHNGILADTLPSTTSWTLDRFDGRPSPSNCGQADGAPPA